MCKYKNFYLNKKNKMIKILRLKRIKTNFVKT